MCKHWISRRIMIKKVLKLKHEIEYSTTHFYEWSRRRDDQPLFGGLFFDLKKIFLSLLDQAQMPGRKGGDEKEIGETIHFLSLYRASISLRLHLWCAFGRGWDQYEVGWTRGNSRAQVLLRSPVSHLSPRNSISRFFFFFSTTEDSF